MERRIRGCNRIFRREEMREISWGEVEEVVRRMKVGKAAKNDGI